MAARAIGPLTTHTAWPYLTALLRFRNGLPPFEKKWLKSPVGILLRHRMNSYPFPLPGTAATWRSILGTVSIIHDGALRADRYEVNSGVVGMDTDLG